MRRRKEAAAKEVARRKAEANQAAEQARQAKGLEQLEERRRTLLERVAAYEEALRVEEALDE